MAEAHYVSIEQFHALDTRVAVIENDIKNKLSNIEKQNDQLLAARTQPPPSSGVAEQLLLLGHRFLDRLDKTPIGGAAAAVKHGPPWWLLAAGGAAIVVVGRYVLTGHW